MTNASWDEIRTAFHVARLGTVSGAAEALGVHHATVIRHVDALEARLGTKLFQRHARGYTATEAGADLLQVAQATDDQFAQLIGRLKGRGDSVTGDLLLTSLPSLSPLVAPALARFQIAHPGVRARYLTGTRLFRLEYGEAHVAIRAGPAPSEPDNVVQPFATMRIGLYASIGYVEANGLPADEAEFADHGFVGPEDGERRAPFHVWLTERVPEARLVFTTTDAAAMHQAVLSGAGIGFLPNWVAQPHLEAGRLVSVWPPDPAWAASLWLVTHVDLHRTAKVQAMLAHLKAEAAGWTHL